MGPTLKKAKNKRVSIYNFFLVEIFRESHSVHFNFHRKWSKLGKIINLGPKTTSQTKNPHFFLG